MPRFLFGYTIGVVPFAFIVAFAGSISTVADSSPAIYTPIAATVILLVLWSVLESWRACQNNAPHGWPYGSQLARFFKTAPIVV